MKEDLSATLILLQGNGRWTQEKAWEIMAQPAWRNKKNLFRIKWEAETHTRGSFLTSASMYVKPWTGMLVFTFTHINMHKYMHAQTQVKGKKSRYLPDRQSND